MKARIMHVISAYDIFGAEKDVINEILLLSTSGIDVMLALIQRDEACPFVDKIRRMNIPYRFLKSRSKFDLKPAIELERLLKEWECDLVHTHKYKADIMGLIAAKRASIPAVSTAHGWCAEDLKARFYETIQAFSWRFFDKLICVSDSYRKKIRHYGVPAKNMIVNHNGIIAENYHLPDPVKARSNFRQRHKIPDDFFTVGMIGRLSIEKGHRFFIEAASHFLKVEKKSCFLIIGSGRDEMKLREIIKDIGIETDVRLIGYVDDMKTAYAGLDAVVMPSLREGLPNTLLEAMAAEKPVIVTRVGGIPEVVDDGVNGILIPPMDSNAICDKLIKLCRDASYCRSLGLRAREKVSEGFNFKKRTEQMIRLYDELIAARRAR